MKQWPNTEKYIQVIESEIGEFTHGAHSSFEELGLTYTFPSHLNAK